MITVDELAFNSTAVSLVALILLLLHGAFVSIR